jgi:hypothetical protein
MLLRGLQALQSKRCRYRSTRDVATRAAWLVNGLSREAYVLVAILDDEKSRCAEMERILLEALPETSLHLFDNAPDMIAWLARHLESVGLVSLAHDLGPSRFRDGMLFDPGTGRDVTDFLVEMDRLFPVVVHTANSTAGKRMIAMLEHAEWPCFRVEPKDDLDWIGSEWVPRVVELLGEPGES